MPHVTNHPDPPNPKITEEIQLPDVGELVTLFELDLRVLDGSTILRFTAGSDGSGNAIVFDGKTYVPLPIITEGFDKASNTAFPRPKLKVSNILNAVTTVMINFNDLLGVPLTRIRTFAKFLDNGSDPDPLAKFPDDLFVIDRKVGQDNDAVEWELASTLDQSEAKIPARVIHKNGCTLIYRTFNPTTGLFDNTKATCPYDGANSFTAEDIGTTDDKDVCAKRLTSCIVRFGTVVDLPFAAFPGTGRTR